jgi:tetratricopeptide (TPR) repeat protein
VLFGIGGDVQGGLFDAFSSDSNDDGSGQLKDEVEKAQKRTTAAPRDAAAWAALAAASVNYASGGDGFDENSGQFTQEGRDRLAEADRAWRRHVALAGEKPDTEVAKRMALLAYAPGGLNKPAEAVKAFEAALENDEDPQYGDFLQLAQFAYLAGQTRKAELAGKRAVELAPKAQRAEVKSTIEQFKTSAAGGSGATAAPAPTG